MATQLINGGSTTTSLADDLHAVAEILLRLPSPAALVRAALASRRWRQVASSPGFLRRYRSRHGSSPLLGLYVPRAHAGLPSFQLADSVRSDRALAKFVRAGDFNLTGLGSHPEWRLLDCHNSRLLLSRGESRAVYDPVSGRESLWFPQNSPLELEGTFISECLLQGHSNDAASFRVVSVQHRGRDQMVRAAEYDSRTRQWHHYQWVKNINRPQNDQAMHAGSLIFWRYEEASLLLLDTAAVEFSILGLPFTFFQPSMYAIGDTEDGVCCLVGLVGSINNLHLQVWLLKEDGAVKTWEPEKKVPVSQVLGQLGRDAQLRQVHAVTNGLALLCWDQFHQFIINLRKMCINAEFECSSLGYPLQMPWPPAVLVETGSETINCVVDFVTHNLLATETTEMNMIVGIQCDKMVHRSKIFPTSKLDHVDDMIHYNQMAIHGSEMGQGTQTTHGNDSTKSVTRTKSRCGSEMVSSDHGGQMIHCNQTAIQGSEMIQGNETTHDNGTAEVTPPTTSRCCIEMDHSDEMIYCNQMVIRGNEMVQVIEMTHGTYTVETAPTTSRHGSEMVPGSKMDNSCPEIRCNQMAIHDREMVQGIEITHGNDTAEAAPAAPPAMVRCRRKNSIIWEHFTTETDSHGCTRACCNYCKRTFACSKTAGTSHLKRHINMGSCPVMKGQVPPSSGRTGIRGSGAAEKPSKRRCINSNTSYLGKMDILTEALTTKQGNEYTMSKCLEVLHDMDNVSDEIKHLALHVLEDATNREIFMSYESRLRGLWLKKEVNKLGT